DGGARIPRIPLRMPACSAMSATSRKSSIELTAIGWALPGCGQEPSWSTSGPLHAELIEDEGDLEHPLLERVVAPRRAAVATGHVAPEQQRRRARLECAQ